MAAYYDPENLEGRQRSACGKFLHYTWKIITCLFTHITLIILVVSYCICGALTFESLEKQHEKEVKKNISRYRSNVTDKLWNLMDNELPVLKEEDFTVAAQEYLKLFEKSLLQAITKDGWDGEEDENKIQWTFEGALFYSIIVITTIGYGHISPKTIWGKVVTIFFAILGIPLMLLCLSNIGDIMATSFRFLYWKVCCYVCTKRPKRSHRRSRSRSTFRSQSVRNPNRTRNASFRRSVRNFTRSADSGLSLSGTTPYHSDTDVRYSEEVSKNPRGPRGGGVARMRTPQPARHADTLPRRAHPNRQMARGGSLDRRRSPKIAETSFNTAGLADSQVLCNKYAVEALLSTEASTSSAKGGAAVRGRRAISMPKQHYLEPPREPSPDRSIDSNRSPGRRRKRPQYVYNPSPKIMSPLGFGHRQRYLDDPESDSEYYYEDEYDYYETGRQRKKQVPIWLCVLLVVSYIFAGAFLFQIWEGWDYLDSAYFCFITLTTIGFGDFVPAKRVEQNARMSIALCSIYLLFGISLLAMSFNLVQEQVIAYVRRIAKTLGIIKDHDAEEEED